MRIANAMLHMNNLKLIAVDREGLYDTYEILDEESMDPGDSIHFASALNSRSGLMISKLWKT